MIRSSNILRIPILALCVWTMLMLFSPISNAQNCEGDECNDNGCNDTSVNDTNIMDLGTGSYGTLQGGLYPNGSNSRPTSHNEAGLLFADDVVPRDANGDPDYVDGKIVLLSIGFSNAQSEFCYFQDKVDVLAQINPYLVVVNGAIGGWPIEDIINDDINSLYWEGDDDPVVIPGVEDMLEDADVTWTQVQAIWFKTANQHPESTSTDGFLNYVHELRNQFVDGMALLQEKFVNNRLCYLSDRTFGKYGEQADPPDFGSPEPFAYWTGWAVKRLIAKQLNGDLPYDGGSPVSPWLSWGPYLWADGTTNRSDGVEWLCEDFRDDDRKHPSDCGKDKVSDMLIDFFSNDETTRSWFLRTRLINSGGDLFVTTDDERFAADADYDGGTTASTTNGIAGTDDDGLYQDYREGTSGGNGGFEYNVEVPNSGSGIYKITLHFADPVSTAANQRLFEIKCEGAMIRDNFDIFSVAGGASTAYSFSFEKAVSDELLTLRFIPETGSTYKPLVCAIEIDYLRQASRVSSVGITSEDYQQTYLLSQNYPNPFNPSTLIRYDLPKDAHVRLKIFDVLGREIITLVDEMQQAGPYEAVVDASSLASGVYFYALAAGEFTDIKRMLLVK